MFKSILDKVVQVVSKSLNNEWSWVRNTSCKYITLRIDMRDGKVLLMNREGEEIELHELEYQKED